MATRKSNPKRLLVDGNPYVYWVRELPYDMAGAVPLNVVVRADYGTRSVCTFTGFKNRERWHDYPDWNEGLVIQITPKVVFDLIGHAHRAGWAPTGLRANVTLEINNSFLSVDSSHKTAEGKASGARAGVVMVRVR